MEIGKINKIVAAIIFFILFGFYIKTAAPTISFWDCGEFVTCSHIMGIPHPPGSPLLSVVGKVLSLIPFYDFRGYGTSEIAYRITILDVILGALSAMFAYLVIVRLIRKFRSETYGKLEDAIIMASAAIAAFLIGFSDEFWTNAVEIETYMPSIFISILSIWLVLKWDDKKEKPSSIKYLFLAAYLIGLGNGFHPLVLLIAPTAFMLVFFSKPEWFTSGKLWFFTALFLLVVAIVKLFLELEYLYFTMALFAFVAPALLFKLYRAGMEQWKLTLTGIVLCFSLFVIGYSVYPTVMVRASKSPSINEGNPSSWDRYKLYLARDQYGQENMYEGMFTRKADAGYQFGFMYLRYLIQQFPKWGPSLQYDFVNDKTPESRDGTEKVISTVYISVFLLSLLLYGLYTHAREDWRRFFALMAFFIASSIGLVLYLNMENPQVRERGYFFLGSYYIIFFWVAFGIYGFIRDIIEWLEYKNMKNIISPVTIVFLAIFATLPPSAVLSNHIDPGFNNYEVHNRTGDWAPYDYGYNILVSCEPDAILFTNGDNDTFPLWYLQEVEGFRKDVRVINLSLLNTDWYILQLKHEGKVLPIDYTDDHISNVLCGREESSLRQRLWPLKGKEISAAGITWNLPAQVQIDNDNGMLRVQDVMVVNIINWINWQRPVYFAVTVADQNKCNLQDYLAMEGMVYHLSPTKSNPNENVNIAALDRNLFKRYKYHELSNKDVYKPPNTTKLVTNYFIGFAQLAERYAAMGDTANAVRAAWGAVDTTTNTLSQRTLLYTILSEYKLSGELKPFLNKELTSRDFSRRSKGSIGDRFKVVYFLNKNGQKATADSLIEIEKKGYNLKSIESKYEFGSKLIEGGLFEQSYDIYKEIVTADPSNAQAVEILTYIMYQLGKYQEALTEVNVLLKLTPNNEKALETKGLLEKMLNMKSTADSSASADSSAGVVK